MAKTISQKLRIKEGMRLRTLHAPVDFEAGLQPLPEGVSVSDKGKKFDQLHWFVTSKAQMEEEVDAVIGMIGEEIVCWTYYPKISSGIQTDLTRDKGWDKLLSHQELQWISLIAFDETWSAFGFRLKTEADTKKDARPQERVIFRYVDPAKKTVQLPEDLATLLEQHPEALSFFEKLSFTNKKEYIEWIVTAKREATRQERLSGTIDRLHKRWKNPRNM